MYMYVLLVLLGDNTVPYWREKLEGPFNCVIYYYLIKPHRPAVEPLIPNLILSLISTNANTVSSYMCRNMPAANILDMIHPGI